MESALKNSDERSSVSFERVARHGFRARSGVTSQNFDVRGIAEATVLFLSGQLRHDALLFQELHRGRRGGERGLQLLTNLLDGESWHQREQFEQSQGHDARARRAEQLAAVLSAFSGGLVGGSGCGTNARTGSPSVVVVR